MLIQEYARGLLPSDTAARVRALIESSPEWATKVDFARATNLVIERKQRRNPRINASLLESTYDELTVLASRVLAREEAFALEPADLVHEAYMKMKATAEHAVRDRAQFLAMAATVMRRVLVDMARDLKSRRRSGEWRDPEMTGEDPATVPQEQLLLDLDFALAELATLDARKSRTVELRLFSGLTFDQIADVLGVSIRTAKRDWNAARAWLQHHLTATKTIQ